ncbi:MAG: hypothetical protein KKD44_23310 [Proteobacteria bacterium]|nr:hypothetical protein [Pseudomonadota bacterium]
MIQTCDEDAFTQFIRNHERDADYFKPPSDLTFEELIKKKKELLSIDLSERALTDRVNQLIQKKNIGLPKLTNTMLTRLKKEPADTPHKRNALRCLSFWIGYTRSDLNLSWNFQTLLTLCDEKIKTHNHTSGVRVGLTLSSRGDVIGHDAMIWLKNNIKNHVQNALEFLPYGSWGKVKSHDVTTIYIDFPKQGRATFPSLYKQSVRNALSVAHQMSIRWALSDHFTKNRFLSIGIAAGDFATLDHYLMPILNAKLPGDPVIRMTDYTHQCILISDIRAVFCSHPKEAVLFNGESLDIWWVEGFWSAIYWDFIPSLIDDEIMQDKITSMELLKQILMFPDQLDDFIEPNAITRFFSFPSNSLLGLEIAKTLYYRRSFWASNEILRIVLSTTPNSLNARSLRMVIYRNLAIESPSHSIAQIHFNRAEEEAEFILENCTTLDEDFFCEYAVINLSKALTLLQRMRAKTDPSLNVLDSRQLQFDVFELLTKTEDMFEKGIKISPMGHRSLYLLLCTQIVKIVLQSHEELFYNNLKALSISKDMYRQKALDNFAAINWITWDDPQQINCDNLEKMIIQNFGRYSESVTLKSYQPTLYFCYAIIFWDFFPLRTVKIVKTVLEFLYGAIPLARELENNNLCIYSYTRCYGEILKPQEFIEHIESSIHMIETHVGTLEELEKEDSNKVLDDNGPSDFTLLTMHI